MIHEEKHGLASQSGFHHDRAAIGNRGAALAHRFAPGYAHCIFRINEADPASDGVGSINSTRPNLLERVSVDFPDPFGPATM